MSPSDSRLPARPSLEQLRKQAKDRLKALRAERPGAKLADAQLELARQYGFESWPKLFRHVEGTRSLESYQRLADALAEAYRSGDFAAIRELNWDHGTQFQWYRDVTRMHEQLPTWLASESKDPNLAVTDSRRIVARKAGFDGWNHLVESLSRPVDTGGAGPADDTFFRVDRERGTMEVRGPLADRHWERVVAVMKDEGLTGLRGGGITDAAMKRITKLDRLTHLEAEGGQLTDDGMSLLARLPRLGTLVVGGPKSRITDRGLETLRLLPALRSFQMTWAPEVSDAGVDHLKGCDELESVDLMGTPTGDGAIAALQGKAKLRRLNTGRLVSDRGLALLHGLPGFRSWQGGERKYSLMSADAGPTFLLLDGPITDGGVAALEGLDGLFGLAFFWHTSKLTAAGLRPLARLPNLGYLGCVGRLCDDEAMGHISEIPGLRMLMAQGTVASDEGFVALSRSQSIEHIWGRECPNLGGRGFRALADMPALRGLAVSCRNVDDESLGALPSFHNLRSLMPMDVTDAGFRHVGGCDKLEELWCMYCRDTGDAATEQIAGLERLRTYYAGHTLITDRSLEILARMATLESIELLQTAAVTNTGVRALAGLPRLREIALEGLSRVTRDVVAAFGAGVRVNYAP